MTTGDRIKQARKTAGLTQKQLAEKVGVKFSAIHKYETGMVVNLKRETIAALADALNVKPSWLMCMEDDAGSVSPGITSEYVAFPVIGEVGAGYDRFGDADWTNGQIDIPKAWLHGRPLDDYFVLRVSGDSMYPTYQNGDLVLVLRQSTMDHSGQIGVVMIDDDIGTLKRIEYVMGENWMKLIPINPQYPPVTIRDEQLEHCRVLGIPKMLIRKID